MSAGRAGRQNRWQAVAAAAPAVLLLVLCCAPVIGWMLWQFIANPQVLLETISARWPIVLATVGYNLAAAVLAGVLALPAAVVIGRGRGWFVVPLLFACAVGLLQPSVVYAYAWREALYMVGLSFRPESLPDVLRCIGTIAGWLWPVPAVVVGLSLRRMDVQLQQQALLDGALGRVTFRHLLPAVLAALAIVLILAMQEFSIYESTGIQVVATEVRAVFQSSWDLSLGSAQSMATALPVIVLVGLIAAAVGRAARGTSALEAIDLGRWPRSLNARMAWYVMAVGVIGLTLVTPVIAMLVSLQRRDPLGQLLAVYGPTLGGSIFYAALVGLAALGVGISGIVFRLRGAVAVSLATFLVGGQMVAIAMIRIYNRPWLEWIYNEWPIAVLAELALFGWLAVLGGRLTWSRPWTQLRDLAQADGASGWQSAWYVIVPVAWPLCAAAAVLAGVLALSEVPAMVLLQPQRPPALIPWLVTWVHMQRSDVMIQGSLLLLVIVMALSALVLLLAWLATRRLDRHRARRQQMRGEPVAVVRMLLVAGGAMALLGGCGGGSGRPDAVWCQTGTGEGQVVYPRAIAYSAGDDTFFVCDRLARIQQFDARGRFLQEWRMPEWETGKPVGLTVAPDGKLWVPDTHYHRVIVYTPRGEEVMRFGSFGKAPGEFVLPTDIAFDAAGNVFVSEYGDNDRIQVFDAAGRFIRQIGSFGSGDGQFARPQSIAIIDDLLYVTDACNHRLVVFRTDGTFVRNIGSVGTELGQFRFPYGLDVDPDGRLVVCEFGNNRVQLIDPETGRGLAAWGRGGREPGELAYPWAVAVDAAGRVVAADAGNNRLQVFEF